MSRLEAVKSVEVADPTAEELSRQRAAAIAQAATIEAQKQALTKMLLLAVQALSQRFVVALANLFTLLTAASAFYLWYAALPALDAVKIVGCSLYSLFVLALNIHGRRK